MFSQDVIAKIGYYVYVYVDPRTEEIFYVGKGKGNRCFFHMGGGGKSLRAGRIREIRRSGLQPRVEIIVHGLKDEETAFRVEAAVIDALGVGRLTNVVRGWGSGKVGRMPVEELTSAYQPQSAEILEPSILIRITQLYRPSMTPIELYDATRGVWKVGSNREKVRYAMAVFEGIVREIYQVEQWFPAGSTFSTRSEEGLHDPERWEFVGRVAEPRIRRKYRYKSVAPYFSAHSQTPFRYVNID